MKDNAKRERFKKVAVKRMEKLIADFESSNAAIFSLKGENSIK